MKQGRKHRPSVGKKFLILNRMQELQLTRTEIARRLGVSVWTVCRTINGVKAGRVAAFFVEHLGCSPNWFPKYKRKEIADAAISE